MNPRRAAMAASIAKKVVDEARKPQNQEKIKKLVAEARKPENQEKVKRTVNQAREKFQQRRRPQ